MDRSSSLFAMLGSFLKQTSAGISMCRKRVEYLYKRYVFDAEKTIYLRDNVYFVHVNGSIYLNIAIVDSISIYEFSVGDCAIFFHELNITLDAIRGGDSFSKNTKTGDKIFIFAYSSKKEKAYITVKNVLSASLFDTTEPLIIRALERYQELKDVYNSTEQSLKKE